MSQHALEARLADAENRLQGIAERYELATAAARVGVWDWNIRSGAFYLDPNIKRLLGYEDSEIPNDLDTWATHIHVDDKEPVMRAAQDVIEGRAQEYVFEHRMRHKDGSVRWFMVRGRVIRDASGAPIRFVGTDTDITDRVRLEQEVRGLSTAIQAQVGRDLHDSLGQELTAIALKTRGLEDRLQAASPDLVDAAHEIRTLTQKAIQTTAVLARGLSPVLGSAGLADSLKQLADDARQLYAIDCEVELPTDIGSYFGTAQADELYRIAQEAITNAVRHGRATRVAIEGRVLGSRFLLNIADNGEGIAVLEPEGTSMGLRIMQYRARSLGGTLTLSRLRSGGTLVVCACPLPR